MEQLKKTWKVFDFQLKSYFCARLSPPLVDQSKWGCITKIGKDLQTYDFPR